MRPRFVPLLSLLLLLQPSAAQHSGTRKAEIVPEGCPVTTAAQGSRFVPPAPYWSEERNENQFWFGTDTLWTNLPADGVWSMSGFAKSFWWRQFYDSHKESRPKLMVTAKRLDGLAPVVKADDATNAFPSPRSAMLIGFDLPTTGCWEITGHYEQDELTFVAWVVQNGP